MNTRTRSFKLNSEEKKIVGLTALGGMLEFYDFVIYGIFSVYFAHQFFPGGNPILTVIKSYMIFILGYIVRPVGGVIFSHFGDEHGRKQVLIITIVLMGVSSLGIGILPTYDQIGIIAPIGLLLLRLLQGLALGGELPSTYVYISESMPNKRGTGFGVTMFGINSGLLLGMIINQILNSVLTPAELSAYGWRLPFIFGGLLCLISYSIRKTLHETSAFTKMQDKPSLPILYLLVHHLPQVMAGIAITAIMSGMVVVAVVFMPTYLHDMLNVNNAFISRIMPLVMLCNIITIYCTGQIANRLSPQVIMGGLLLLCAILIPLSYWLISGDQTSLMAGLIILGILEGMAAMMVPLMICNFFPTKIRLTGVALCYNVGFTLFGGLAPIIISSLINSGYNIYYTPMIYLLVIVAICGLGLFVNIYFDKRVPRLQFGEAS